MADPVKNAVANYEFKEAYNFLKWGRGPAENLCGKATAQVDL